MIWLPVRDSPTKATAFTWGCSVKARPATSPMPCTRFNTPGGSPAAWQISASRVAVSGLHSAGLCTTVHPAASAGAIFQVESIKGVFQGVMTPTGPRGWRNVKLWWCAAGNDRPLAAAGARSAKKRKFSAPRTAALLMNRSGWPVSQDSTRAISSARCSMASAMRCSTERRASPEQAPHSAKASQAALAAWSTSSGAPAATWLMREPSIGVLLAKVSPEAPGTASPPMKCPKTPP